METSSSLVFCLFVSFPRCQSILRSVYVIIDTPNLFPAPSTVAPAPSQQTEVNKKVPLPQGFIFSIPYMVSVGGAVILLLCLLIIGLIVQPGRHLSVIHFCSYMSLYGISGRSCHPAAVPAHHWPHRAAR